METTMEFNYVAGIDVASETFAATVEDSGVEVTALTCPNTLEGIDELLARISERDLPLEEVLFCLEPTGGYSELLCYVLTERGLTVSLVDPAKVKRQADDPGHKTDELDSKRLADYARRYADKLKPWVPNSVAVEQIDVLLTTREQLVKQKTATSNLLRSLKRKWVQTPAANAMLEQTLEQLKCAIKELEKSIREVIRSNPAFQQGTTLLVSIPGVSYVIAASVLVLTRGFTTTFTARQAAAFLGIAPRPYTSGTSVRGGTHSRGYGPGRMRQLLHLSARCSLLCNQKHRNYFDRKKAEGKHGSILLNNLANKQLQLMFAILKNRQPYRKNHRSVNPQLLTKP